MTAEEFDEFYGSYAKRLTGHVFALTGNLSEAQDVVQEAFMRAWDRRGQLDMSASPEAWVRTVAMRLAISRWRRARRAAAAWQRHGPSLPSSPPGPDVVALVEALRRIPAVQRQAIVLHHLVDLPVDRVAVETGVPVGTVKARLSRGRAALARLLTEDVATEAVDV
ncbi:MAG: SigE family RNA polymerase sigma factor [Carbonactinosporaceae bacterium]